jgi:alkylated DNA repair protein (DNA oxidative demethylase)
MNLFSDEQPSVERLSTGTVLLHNFTHQYEQALLEAISTVIAHSPWRHMQTPGGKTMLVAMSNCGNYGWVSDNAGYRYATIDPLTKKPWLNMPSVFLDLATQAAQQAGFNWFIPDACLLNRYDVDTRLSLHQDKDEQDFAAPIVSVSLGLPATFLLGGLKRSDKTHHLRLTHGDVLVWGGEDRLRFHGVLPLESGNHQLLGAHRLNLTFRKARGV